MSTSDKFKGKAKETLGKVTGDRQKESEGKAQHTKGRAKESTKDVGDQVRGTAKGITGDDRKR